MIYSKELNCVNDWQIFIEDPRFSLLTTRLYSVQILCRHGLPYQLSQFSFLEKQTQRWGLTGKSLPREGPWDHTCETKGKEAGLGRRKNKTNNTDQMILWQLYDWGLLNQNPHSKLSLVGTEKGWACQLQHPSVIDYGQSQKQWQILFSWAPKSLRMVTAVMKLKDACSLEEKLWPT